MRLRLWLLLILIAALTATLGCGNKPSEEQQSTSENGEGKSPSLMQRMTGASKATLPQGTLITVRLGETISTKSAKAGDRTGSTSATRSILKSVSIFRPRMKSGPCSLRRRAGSGRCS